MLTLLKFFMLHGNKLPAINAGFSFYFFALFLVHNRLSTRATAKIIMDR